MRSVEAQGFRADAPGALSRPDVRTCGMAGSEADTLIPVLVQSTPWGEVGTDETDVRIHGDTEKPKQGRAMGYTKAKGHTVPSFPLEPPRPASRTSEGAPSRASHVCRAPASRS